MSEHHNAVKDAIINVENFLGTKNNPEEGSFNYKLREQESRFLTPKASFFGFPSSGPPSLKVRFQNFSSGDVIRNFWDFGDGTYSTENSPTHVYSEEGIFTIKLNIVTSTGGQGATTKYNYITVSEEKKPTFFYVVVHETVQTILSTEASAQDSIIYVEDTSLLPSQGIVVIDQEYISYRNKTSNSLKMLTRGYGSTQASVHNVNSTVKKAYYSEQTATARAASGIEPTATSTTFKFVDQSDGNISERYWIFGDGESESQPDPDIHATQHTYALPGTYNAILLLVFSDQRTKRVFMPTIEPLVVI
jgi:PKD repeat protein